MPPVAPHQVNFTIKEPFGVVAAIVPFNFPLLLMAWKVAPGAGGGEHAGLQAAAPESALATCCWPECYDRPAARAW